MTAPPPVAPPSPAAGSVRVDRVGPEHYLGHNGRAAAIPIGPAGAPGRFSPTELLRIALAGCEGLAADHVLTRRLGERAGVTIAVHGDHDPAQRRLTAVDSTITLDLSGLDEAARDQLRTVVTRAVHRYCTVGRTLEHGAPTSVTVLDRA
ncbi:OsmC family protein [Nakamurella sp.]|uniref:OsmC family protein n=1 Tax=Nakamurella sp. TaxID=1869182 RepID=UPI003B3AB6E5